MLGKHILAPSRYLDGLTHVYNINIISILTPSCHGLIKGVVYVINKLC